MLALLLLLSGQAQAESALAPDTEARWVPFELTPGNHIRFEILVNGRAARAVLDTGLSDTIVSTRFAAIAGLKARRTQRARAIGGRVEIGWASADSLSLGGLTRRGGRVGISAGGGQERFGADVLLGADVLGCCALDLDYDARRFRILPSGRLPFTGVTLPLARRGVYHSEIGIGGRRVRPVIVDTGDGGALTLGRAAWLSLGYGGAPMTTTIGWGLGGPVVTYLLVLPGVTLGTAAPVEAEVRIEPAEGYSESVGAAGRIGTGLLLRYRVLLDPRAGRMVLVPASAAAAPVARSTSGLLLEHADAALRVLHVMRNSPAAEAGWRAGETICAIDGAGVPRPADGVAPLDWSAGTPGRIVRLTLCDGSERRLTLRRFY